jgi:hypothetical protein
MQNKPSVPIDCMDYRLVDCGAVSVQYNQRRQGFQVAAPQNLHCFDSVQRTEDDIAVSLDFSLAQQPGFHPVLHLLLNL